MTTRNAPAKNASLPVLRARAAELGVDFKGYYRGFTGTPLTEATAMTAKKAATRKKAITRKKTATRKASAKRATTKKATPRKRAMTKKAAAKKANGAAKGDGLGRAGTMGHAMREGIVNGIDRDTLLKQVREQFPKHNIGDYYYSWYRRDCEKRGLISAD